MSTAVGVWIDHRKAVISIIAGGREELQHVTSKADKHVHFAGGAQKEAAEDQQDRRFAGQLDQYYDLVIAHLRDFEKVLIMGPGEAKTELHSRMAHSALGERVVAIEAADRMTDHQVAARVRLYFLSSLRKLAQVGA